MRVADAYAAAHRLSISKLLTARQRSVCQRPLFYLPPRMTWVSGAFAEMTRNGISIARCVARRLTRAPSPNPAVSGRARADRLASGGLASERSMHGADELGSMCRVQACGRHEHWRPTLAASDRQRDTVAVRRLGHADDGDPAAERDVQVAAETGPAGVEQTCASTTTVSIGWRRPISEIARSTCRSSRL